MSERRSEEPSMEEILASIRRIISEESGAASEGARGTGAAEERKDEVLELMDEVQDDGSVRRLVRETAATPKDPAASVAPVAPAAAAAPASGASPPESGLISATATEEARHSLAELASAVAREETRKGVDVPLGVADRTLAEIVTELLRPLLREWLEKNLPELIERLVRKEIEKLVRRAENR